MDRNVDVYTNVLLYVFEMVRLRLAHDIPPRKRGIPGARGENLPPLSGRGYT